MKKRKALRLIIIIVSLYLAFTTAQGIIGYLSSGEKVTRREKVLSELEKEKKDLLRKEKQLAREEFLERVAYDELGLSRPGEKVIIIPKELLAIETPKAVVDNTPNWKKWMELLL